MTVGADFHETYTVEQLLTKDSCNEFHDNLSNS
jgi:hypothetical protein